MIPHAVFVVDDEPVIASTLVAVLKLNGYCAKAFTSPLEALAAARLKAPDLLISDVMMPELSGIDLAIRLKGHQPNCRVLLLSGHAYTQDFIEDARRKGHDFPILHKPVPPSELLASIAGLPGCLEAR